MSKGLLEAIKIAINTVEKSFFVREPYPLGVPDKGDEKDRKAKPKIEEEKGGGKKFVTKFGKKNLREFLQEVGVEGDFFGKWLREDNELANDPEFFHHFALRFNLLWAEAAFDVDNKERFALEPDHVLAIIEKEKDQFLKRIETNFKKRVNDDYDRKDSARGDRDKFLDEKAVRERFSKDFRCERKLAGVNVRLAQTIGVNYKRNQQDAACFGLARADSGFGDSRNIPVLLQQELAYQAKRIREKQQQLAEENVKIAEENKKIEERMSKEKQVAGSETKLAAADEPKPKALHEISGTTVLVVHCSTDHKVTVGNIGDSRAVLFYRKNGKVFAKRLTADHSPGDALEQLRIKREGGQIIHDGVWRVNGDLSVSHSVGDFGKKNISPESDPCQFDVGTMLASDPQIDQVWLGLFSDGFFGPKKNESMYVAALDHWFQYEFVRDAWDGNIAEYLRDCAVIFGSSDNITDCFIDLTDPPKKNLFAAICDGHSGQETSQDVMQDLAARFLHPEKRQEQVLLLPVTPTSAVANANAQAVAGACPCVIV
jgi:serine/threonine protein phosphatase PrpC